MQEKEYTWCFACGKDNPIGLKWNLQWMPRNVWLILHPDRSIKAMTENAWRSDQRLTGRDHGPLPVRHRRKTCLYGKMELRYRQPVMIGETVKCVGRRLKQKGRLVEMQGQIITKDGIVAAEAVAK